MNQQYEDNPNLTGILHDYDHDEMMKDLYYIALHFIEFSHVSTLHISGYPESTPHGVAY